MSASTEVGRLLTQLVGDSNEGIKSVLEALVDKHGARLVAENLVEVYHDKAGDSAKGVRTDEQLRWLRLATTMGNKVHHTNMEWPS